MSRSSIDRWLLWLLRACALVAASVLLLILAFLVIESWPALREIGVAHFFGDRSWHPAEQQYNLSAMFAGTVLCTLGALLFAVPLGIAAALFGRFYARGFLAGAFRRMVELMAGIPSVVYGLWGLTAVVPLIGRLSPPGTSLLAGMLVLALMILPTIALTADAALAGVSRNYINGAVALGLSRWGMIRGVAVPAARAGIASGVLLAAARALGETMAVLMVCGNVVRFPLSVFDPVRTLTANIALEMAYAMEVHRGALFVSGLGLMLLVLLIVGAAEPLSRGKRHA